jgi:SPW repeat
MRFSFPKEWQDWVNLLLGVWLCVAPWILHFTDDVAATNNVVLVGFLVICSEVFTFSALRIVEEWIDVVLGAWLVISVWSLSISTPIARIAIIVTGLVVLLFSFYEIWDNRHTSTTHA